MSLAVITIGIDPEIHLGPLTIAWHGLTIAIGILLGGWVASRWLERRGHDPDPMVTLGMLLAVAGILGGRLFYVLEHGGPLLATRGFTFDGGVIAAAVVLFVAVRRMHLQAIYLDAIALALPLGVAVGRIGDIINGEHYGAQSTSFLAVRNSVGRFFEFFLRSDSPQLALGLSNAQWTSVAVVAAVVVGRTLQTRRRPGAAREPGAPRAGLERG